MITSKFDLRSFNADLQKAIKVSSRSAQQVTNSKALSICSLALKLTEKADRNKIEQSLSQEGKAGPTTYTRVIRSGKNKGKSRTETRYTRETRDDSLAARLVNAHRKWRGEKPIFGEELQRAAEKLIGAKLSSIAFIKSGWVSAIQDILRGMGKSAGGKMRDGAKVKGDKKGGATMRNSRMQSFAVVIWNTALLKVGKFTKPGQSKNPMPIAEKALRQAFVTEQNSMREHIANKLKVDLQSLGGKVT